MKADKIPLIQEHVGITISNNVVTIAADEQLTTTSGRTLIELQFINTSTGQRKATFNLALMVNHSTLNIGGTISTATYTLMQELENKLDQATSYFDEITDFLNEHPDIPALDDRVTENTSEIDQINISIADKANETDLFSNFLWKLRNKSNVTICCMGDSITYGSDFISSDKRNPDTTKTDNGISHTATRASVTYPEALQNYLSQVYGNIITVLNHGFSGDGTKNGYEHWNASNSDLCIINYGINDATNTNIEYMGDVKEYLIWYRKIIERELRNGTAVIILKPTRQRLIIGSNDTDSRVDVDIFSNACELLAKEYNLPCIDGQEMLMNYSASIYSDETHLNGIGYNILGARISSIFIGEGISNPFEVTNQSFQGVEPHIHSVIYNGGSLNISQYYPTADDNITNQGTAATINSGDKLYFSFYSENDGLVAIPTLYTSSTNLVARLSLDFGVQSSDYNNDYDFGRVTGTSTNPELPSTVIDIPKSLFDSAGVYSGAFFKTINNPMIYISKKGWHTICIEILSGTGGVTVHGLEYYYYNILKNKFGEKIELTLLNGTTNYYSYPLTALKSSDGKIVINGVINNITSTKPATVATLPADFCPSVNLTFVVALSSSASGGYAVVLITPSGNINIVFMSTTVAYCNLNGITFQV